MLGWSVDPTRAGCHVIVNCSCDDIEGALGAAQTGLARSMQSEWKVQTEKPRFAISRLASLQVESPINSQTQEGLGVLVVLWCGRESIQVSVEAERRTFSFGFTVGELEVSIKNGRISAENRYKQEIYREKIDQNAKDTSTNEGKVGGAFGVDFSKFFLGAKVGAEAAGNISKGSAVIEEKKGEYYRVYWRVADAGYKYWKCFGFGLNEDNVLENKILGEDVLCYVLPDAQKKEVHILVKYVSDLKDLWFRYEPEAGSNSSPVNDFHRNRELVASAIIAKALNRSSRRLEGTTRSRLVLLCQQRMVATRATEAV